MNHKSDTSHNRILKNGVFQGLQFFAYLTMGLFLIPFLVKMFGADNFGLIAMSSILIQYIGVMSGCVGSAITRFLNISINHNNWQEAREIFSTAIVANMCFIALQLPLLALVIWKLDWLINYNSAVEFQLKILVLSTFFVFFIGIMEGVLSVPMIAINRIDLISKITTLQVLSKILILYLLLNVLDASFILIAVVDSVLALVRFIFVFLLYRKYRMQLTFSRKSITFKWLKPIFTMSGWMILAALGFCLFRKTDVWIVNRFINEEMTGIFAALLIWPNFIVQLGNQISSIITPVYMIDFARGDLQRIARFSLFLAKNLSCFASITAGVLCANASFILSLWMGSADFLPYTRLFQLIVINVVLTLNQAAFSQLFPATNNVRSMSICTIMCGILNIVTSITLVKLGYGAEGVAVGTVISAGLLYGVCFPLIASRILHVPLRAFVMVHCSGLICLAVVFLSSIILNAALVHSGMLLSLVKIAASGTLGVVAALIMQSKSERKILHSQIMLQLQRLNKNKSCPTNA